MSKTIEMAKGKRTLATIWLSVGGFLLIVVFIQTILGHYGDKANEAWSWLLPVVLPTLSLIVGVLVSDSTGKGVPTKTVDGFVFRLSVIISVIYLLCAASVVFLSPLVKTPVLEMMKISNLGLGPMQGLVSACIGIFFTSKEKK
jgi:hypothetical protein